jgi:hypothetical protein
MHLSAAIRLGVALAGLVSGCGDCLNTHITTECQVTGDLQGEWADGTTYSNEGPGLEASCPTVSYGGRSYSGGGHPVSSPQDLDIGLTFDARVNAGQPAAGGAVVVTLKLVVRDVAPGPSEIDLDDTRATISGWSGLQGHLSIRAISQDCSHGDNYCLLALHATLSVSAGGSDGNLTLTGVALDALDAYRQDAVMCTGIVGE